MKPICLLVVTGTNGAPVQISTDGTISCNSIFIQPYTGAGVCYLGTSALDVSSGAGMIAIIPASGSFSLPQAQNSMNQLSLSAYYVAGTGTGDKLLVTYWVS